MPALSAAQLVRPEPEPDWLDETGVRFGLVAAGLVDSGQGRPFVYLDFGVRRKDNDWYFDAKLGALPALMDYGFRAFQESFIASDEPFSLIESLNEPIQYGAHLEALSIRLGKTFTSFPFSSSTPLDEAPSPLRLSVGPTLVAELVFFDLPLLNSDPADFDGPDVNGANDPIVLGAGGFVSLGGKAPGVAYDVALVVAQDVFNYEDYAPLAGQVIALDAEAIVELGRLVGFYSRFRVSTYTHVDAFIVSMATNLGFYFGF